MVNIVFPRFIKNVGRKWIEKRFIFKEKMKVLFSSKHLIGFSVGVQGPQIIIKGIY